ncbi:HEAT repeat domain-containing protein, partial [bacterium]|nr:HEAT repeat domain-containing protein [bacterium]
SFGWAIGRAETEEAKGILPLTVWRKGKTQTVDLKLQTMGTYSDTSPHDCPKARKILEQGCALIAKDIKKENRFPINELALMASGNPAYMGLVRESAHALAAGVPETEKLWEASSHNGKHTWGFGYRNVFLAEYYLATGDKTVLPAIRAYTACIARGQGRYGTWGHGLFGPGRDGKLHGPVPPYGPVNQAGLPCFVSLVLARKCGIKDPELVPAIARANKFFGYYAGKGAIPYGEHRPGICHDDNGKTSIAAMAFALQGRRAETQFFSKMVTASYESREWGHCGNGFSYVWGPIAANCGGPKAIAAFMKELRWYHDLARRWDGAFVYIGTGGGVASSYRSVFNSTGSYMLGYAVPLKKLHITGRDANQDNWLSDADVAEAIAAERWLGDNAHANRTAEQLLAGLSSWSPLERAWSARELGKRKDNVLPQLLAMIRSNKANGRLGAVIALGQLKARAIPALDAIAGLLDDEDRWVRVQAAEALRNIGAQARPVLHQMLRATAVKDETDPMEFRTGALAYALFYPGGSYGPRGILAGSLEGVDKRLLYPAIRAVAANPDSHARGCLRSTYALITLDDARALAPEFLASVKEMAPANTMFSKGVRLAGIQAMARLRVEEGIPLALMMINLRDWGRNYITMVSLNVLKEYRGAARSALPELKKLEAQWRAEKRADFLKKLAEVVAAIESDNNPPELISLKDYLGKDNGGQ